MRSPLPARPIIGAAVIAGVMLLAPTPAHAASTSAGLVAPEAASASFCTVSQAQLTWGFKESFRSYISGSIAHGQWEPAGGVTYATPAFSWSTATGSTVTGTISPDGASAEAALTGAVRFTGHDGLLDTTIANPTLVIDTPTHAILRLDVSGVSMEAALAGDKTATTAAQVPFVDVDLSAATVTSSADGVTMVVTDAPTAVTAEGFAAFGNYEPGTPFDPITIDIAAVCATDAPASSPEATATAVPISAAAEPDAASDTVATLWGIGAGVAAALVVVGVSAAAVLRGRRASAGAPVEPGAQP